MSQYSVISEEKVSNKTKDKTVNIVLHTIKEGKQVLIFNNSKSRSEATAEKISDAILRPDNAVELRVLADKILKSLQSPTKQCKRLARIIAKGVAFHHSGLTSKQRSLIENSFREGLIKAISSTPTLAAGLNLPAYKVIINDYKRYSSRGFNDIPVLEFHQMSGRAGRPGKEDIGKAVLMVKSEDEMARVIPKYVFGEAEEIISKLAVEPTLKMYMLSLVAMDMINTTEEIKSFFANTLYAHQYKDLEALNFNIFKILNVLKDYNFITQEDEYYMATQLGKKISELYLNPDTANYFLEHIEKFFERFATDNVSKYDIYSLIYFIADTVEMKPLFTVKKIEEEKYVKKAEEIVDTLVVEFDPFESDYSDFMKCLKAADIMSDWIDEAPEDYISDKYNVTPGELHYKLEVMDWLIYCIEELTLLKKNFYFKNYLNKLRIRFKMGVRQELIALISLKGIGRVRARNLFKAGFKKINDLKKADFAQISRVLGDAMTIKIKEQLKDESKYESEESLNVANNESSKPKEIKVREVTDVEVEDILESVNTYEREKSEGNRDLNDFF